MTARSPEMRVVRGWGTGIQHARHTRIWVDGEGVLRSVRPGEQPQVITSAATATRAIWLTPTDTRALLGSAPGRLLGRAGRGLSRRLLRRRMGAAVDPSREGADVFHAASYSGALVVMEGDTPVLVAPLQEFVPWAGEHAERRETSGATAVVRALGLVLEARTDDDVLAPRALRAVAFSLDPRRAVVSSAALLLSLTAGVLAFLTWPFGGSRTGVVLGIASLAAAAWPVWALVRSRRAFLALVTTPPEPSGRGVYRLPRSRVGDSFAQLQLGARDVVIATGAGLEVWLPGPDIGGVTVCHVADDDIHLKDDKGRIMHVMLTDDVVPEARMRGDLAAACAHAGIAYRDDPLWIATANLPVRFVHDSTNPPGLSQSAWDQGAVVEVLDDLLLLGAVMLLAGGIAAAVSQPPWGWIVVAGAVVWLSARVWSGQVHRRWRRGVMTAQAAR